MYSALDVKPHPNFLEIGNPTIARVLEYEEQIKSLEQELDKIKNNIDKCIFLVYYYYLLYLLFDSFCR